MSSVNFVSISFPLNCDVEKPLYETALHYLETMQSNEFPIGEVVGFLTDVKDGKCVIENNKGDAFSWASQCNYFCGETLLENLTLFFVDLWNKKVIPPYHGIVIMSNYEQSNQTQIIQIRSPGLRNWRNISAEQLEIKKLVGDFYWMFDN